jgi:hypothetical protein
MATMSRKKLLHPKEAAEFICKPIGTLNNWRHLGYGPAYVKVGYSVRYFEEDLLRFLEANRIVPTDQDYSGAR